MALTPITRSTLSDAVYEQLSAEIVHGHLEVGEVLPAERDLARVLGVNRQAVREALKRLVQAGLIDVRQGGGARVLDYARSASLDVLPRLLFRSDGSVAVPVARSVIELRGTIGPEMAGRAAERRPPEVVEALHEVLERMSRDAGVLEALSEHTMELWGALASGSGNVAFQLAFNSLRGTFALIRGVLLGALAPELTDLEGAQALVAAVDAQDGKAARAAAGRLLDKGAAGVEQVLAQLAQAAS